MRAARLMAASAALAALGGCFATLKPEIVCNPRTGEAGLVDSFLGITTMKDIRADRECAAFKPAAAANTN